MRSIATVAVVLGLAGLVGCQSGDRSGGRSGDTDLLPMPGDDAAWVDNEGRNRSLVLSPAGVPDPEAEPYLPWYMARNDRREPSVTVGYETPALLYAETYTYDRQYTWDGRVREYFNSTTRRGEIIQGVR